ncbi:MAG: hypothetical protein PHX07_02075 [Candidatus Marinimicrobia bacterium]|nr:hypothetical protein [Candidatus Neomarinimicrobiota bacterium]
MATFQSLAEFLALLQNVKPLGDGRFTACCPGHDDKSRSSLCITADSNGIGVKCFALCPPEQILNPLGLELRDLFFTKQSSKKGTALIEKTYDYIDENETLLYQVIRYKPKDFRQRRPDGRGGWIWNLKNVRRILYHLRRLYEAREKNKAVFFVEGEKDVESLEGIGCYATSSPQGAGFWRDELADQLRDLHVIIIPDNDEPGLKHANQVALSIQGKAASVHMLILPGGVSDVSDWIAVGGNTKEKLAELISELDEWIPPAVQVTVTRDLPEIDTSFKRTRDLTVEALNALDQSNNPPFLFIRSGLLSRIVKDEKGASTIDILNEKALRGILDRCANWIKQTKNGFSVPDKPPLDVVNDILSIKHWDFPPLIDITESPIITQNGDITSIPGYNPTTQLYYAPAKGFELPPIPDKPTKDDVGRSLDVLNDVICDFPFDDNSSRTNALATIITPIVRTLINGITPMVLFDKPQPGTGASKLADVVSIIATGRTFMLSPLKEDDEWRKQITTLLLNSTPVITFDNVDRRLKSPSLAKLLTSDLWRDRILGRSEPVVLHNRTLWMATGNNIKLNNDIARRCYKIRLDAKMSRPWQRTNFKHPKLLPWIHENRPAIIAAILTIARAWIQAGKPEYQLPTMDYIAWEKTVGNILTFCGVKDFMGNLNSIYEDNDEENTQWESFIECWHDELGVSFYTCADIEDKIKINKSLSECLPAELSGGADNKSFTRKLGKALASKNGMHFTNGLFLEKGKTIRRALTWRVGYQKTQCEFGEFVSDSENKSNNSEANNTQKSIDLEV